MKIIQINATYGKGSTGCLARDIHQQLKDQGHESYVFWATSCKNFDNDSNVKRVGSYLDHKLHALLRRLDFGQGFHSKCATRKLCKQLSNIKPDVVHLHNLHSNYIHLPILYKYLKENNIPTLLTLHDCWFFTGFCTYPQAYKCEEWKNGCKNCRAVNILGRKKVSQNYQCKAQLVQNIKLAINGVSKWTEKYANQSCLSNAVIRTYIYNWVDMEQYKPTATKDEIYQKYGIDSTKKLILGVAQGWNMNDSKGGAAFCKMREILNERAEIILVGQNNGVEEQEGLHCIGYTANRQELVNLYAAADIFVNPSRFETFGLVTIEAMACGTPVVAYDNTGSSELVIDECGKLVEDGNLNKLIETVSLFLEEDLDCYKERCISYVRENFDKIAQVKKYAQLYETLKTCTVEGNHA